MGSLIRSFLNMFAYIFDFLSHFVALGFRVYVGMVFLKSGWVKLQDLMNNDFEKTLALFKNDYKVPYIDPTMAAYIATAAEVVLPVLVIAGFLSRLPMLGLFLFNIMVVVSQEVLYKSIYSYYYTGDKVDFEKLATAQDHIIWGSMLALLLFHGGGRISLDGMIKMKAPLYKI